MDKENAVGDGADENDRAKLKKMADDGTGAGDGEDGQ